MKKIIAPVLLLLLFALESASQTNRLRPKSISVSFIMNDFATAQRIRSSSFPAVVRDKKVAKFGDMDPGFGLSYIKGLTPNIDLAATLGGSFVTINLPNKNFAEDRFLAELDASANFKMFTEAATVNPYLIAGVGVSKYASSYGAFVPLGGGVKVNLFDETQFSVQLQYRVPVITETNNYHFQVSFGVSGLL